MERTPYSDYIYVAPKLTMISWEKVRYIMQYEQNVRYFGVKNLLNIDWQEYICNLLRTKTKERFV